MLGCADAQSRKTIPADATTNRSGTKTSFGSLKQIDAGVTNVGYAEAGPSDGPAVIRWSQSNCASNCELRSARKRQLSRELPGAPAGKQILICHDFATGPASYTVYAV